MVIEEVFPNPTVKQVIFEIKYPNLFYIETKIGDFQVKIMKEYPKSELLYRKRIVFADLGPKGEFKPLDEEIGKKVWEFKSDKNYSLRVTTNSLHMVSEHHKTYNLEGADKFRDAINFAVTNFMEVMAIPLINRIGLRYIDECPLPSKDNDTFKSYYNSVFPINRFSIADAEEMFFRTVIKKDKFNLIYMEVLQKEQDKYKLIFDFDGFANNVESKDYLQITDELHKIISAEYEQTIREPVYEYMRKKVQ
jgi:uncharacterized protein (TIGR04255 family)